MRIWQVVILCLCTIILTGCAMLSSESVKVRDLEYTVLSSQVVPEELMALIEEKGGEPFQFTYRDKTNLYICIGYGTRENTGYQIVVEELYLTESAVYVQTILLGPKEKGEKSPNNPIIVIKTENLEQQVIYK